MSRIDKLNEMLLSSPDDCFLLHALGLEYQKLEQNEKALECFRKVLHVNTEYVGTYYHLGRTLEQNGLREDAIAVYEKGIEIAGKLKDLHARNELQMALDDLLDE